MVRIQELEPFGGGGGAPFFLDNITKIDKIIVAYTVDGINGFINAITIHCQVNGVQKPPVTWGKVGGKSAEKKNEVENKTCYPILPGPFEQFPLERGEYITSIKGYSGTSRKDDLNVVRQLTFVTNKKEETYGIEVGTSFELPANNGTIVGFHGRAGNLIDALGVFIMDDPQDHPHTVPQLVESPYQQAVADLSRQISELSTNMTRDLTNLRMNVEDAARRADTMHTCIERIEHTTTEMYFNKLNNTMSFTYPRAGLFSNEWYGRARKDPPSPPPQG